MTEPQPAVSTRTYARTQTPHEKVSSSSESEEVEEEEEDTDEDEKKEKDDIRTELDIKKEEKVQGAPTNFQKLLRTSQQLGDVPLTQANVFRRQPTVREEREGSERQRDSFFINT